MRRLLAAAVLSSLAIACAGEDPVAPAPPRGAPPVDLPPGLAPPAAIARALPDRLGTFRATGDAEHDLERGLTPTSRASRTYRDDGDRVATLRVVDASRAPELALGFAAAQQLPMPATPEGDELLPTGIAGLPALASWAPSTETSEAQLLVARRFVVALSIVHAAAPDEAVTRLEGLDLAPLEALASSSP